MRILAHASSLFALVTTALANTEKTIFIAPSAITLPESGASLDALQLQIISPSYTKLRTALPVKFPSSEYPQAHESWYLLQGLKAGQRHEVRVCWAAIVRPYRHSAPSSTLGSHKCCSTTLANVNIDSNQQSSGSTCTTSHMRSMLRISSKA